MIETIEGSKEIKNVEFGDYVLTRSGYRRVVASYMTNDAAKVYTVKLSNGKTITATPNHPIFIKDKGFVDVDSLVCGDILLSIEENNIWQNEKKLNSTETCTTDILKLKSRITENITGAHIKEDLSIYIEIFMSIIMVGFPKAITYITKMMTIIIIPMIISRLSRRKSITKDIERRIVEGLVRQSISHNSNLSESLLKHGIKQSTGRSGTGEMVLNLIKNENLLNEYVMSVVRAMVQWAGERPTGIAQNFVETDSLKNPRNITLPQNALSAEVSSFNINIEQNTGEKHVPVSVVGIYDEKKISPVYNITVEDDHEYYANGVLTHNCEAMVWGLTYLVSVTRNNRYSPPLVGNTRDKLTQYNRIFRI